MTVLYNELNFTTQRELGLMNNAVALWQEGIMTPLAENYFGELKKVGFNQNSGYVWLEDEDYNCLMECDGQLDLHIHTPYHGHEGFLVNLLEEYEPEDLHSEDLTYIVDLLGVAELVHVPSEWAEYNN